MFALVLMVLFGLLVAFFATQNTATIPITLFYNVIHMPVYALVLLSLLFGFVVAWILSAIGAVSSFFTLRQKDSVITTTKRHEADLVKRVKDLEIENTRLKERIPHTSILG